MKNIVVYSSLTGNTKMVAEAVAQALETKAYDLKELSDNLLDGAQQVIFGFWVDKGTADPKSLAFIRELKNKKVGFFFTLGAYPHSQHAQDVEDRVRALLEENGNEVLQSFRCMGKIDPALTARFEKMGENSPHKMDAERRARHEEASKHPDDTDLQNAQNAFLILK